MRKYFVIVSSALLLISFSFLKPIKPIAVFRMKVQEPSDICVATNPNEFMLLANKAFLYRMNESGEIIGKSDFVGYDLEAICQDEKYYYISEETFKEIYVLDKNSLQLVRTILFHHEGGRNEGIEAMVFFPDEKKFILSTEKDPQMFFELDEELNLISTFEVSGIREVSAMTFHDNKWYVLSDEESTVYVVDRATLKITNQFTLPIINPEGIAFTSDGKMLVVSDDMAKLFQFNLTAQ